MLCCAPVSTLKIPSIFLLRTEALFLLFFLFQLFACSSHCHSCCGAQGLEESSGSDFCSLGSHKSRLALNCDFFTFPVDNFLFGVLLYLELLFSLSFSVSEPSCFSLVLPWSGVGCVWNESRWSSRMFALVLLLFCPQQLSGGGSCCVLGHASLRTRRLFQIHCLSCCFFPWLTVPFWRGISLQRSIVLYYLHRSLVKQFLSSVLLVLIFPFQYLFSVLH